MVASQLVDGQSQHDEACTMCHKPEACTVASHLDNLYACAGDSGQQDGVVAGQLMDGAALQSGLRWKPRAGLNSCLPILSAASRPTQPPLLLTTCVTAQVTASRRTA